MNAQMPDGKTNGYIQEIVWSNDFYTINTRAGSARQRVIAVVYPE